MMNDNECGKITVTFCKHGNWQDLAEILLLNGYSLKISMVKATPFDECETSKIEMTISKEVN